MVCRIVFQTKNPRPRGTAGDLEQGTSCRPRQSITTTTRATFGSWAGKFTGAQGNKAPF